MESESRRGGDSSTIDITGTTYMITVAVMEELFDKLKLLNYGNEFCKKMGFRPLSRHYFALPTNSGEQFFTFTSIAAWLLNLCGRNMDYPQEYDDPNATVSSILDECKQLGITADFPPSKLKTGSGEQVCYVLDHLVDEALKVKKFVWSRPDIPEEEIEEEAIGDDDAEVTVNKLDEEMIEEDEDEAEEDEAYLDLEALKNQTSRQDDSNKPDAMLQSTVDAAEWKLEVERVLPMLKVHIRGDNKDWRNHHEQMQQHSEGIKDTLSETKGFLDKLQQEISKTLEKISSREKYVNNQLEQLLLEYRGLQDTLAETKERYRQSSGGVTQLTKALAQITEDLESVKAEMDERGTNMTDSGPLVRIKQALTRLKSDVSQMELRTGVIEQSLTNARLRDKNTLQENMQATVADSHFGEYKVF